MTTDMTPFRPRAAFYARIKFKSLNRCAVWLLFLILTGLTLQIPTTLAHEKNESATLSTLKFTAGLISSYAFHEAGHALAAALTHTDLEWGLGTYNQPLGFTERADSDGSGFLVHASGLATQLIVSEIILQSDAIDNNDSFVRGIMWWNILNPLIYAFDYWVIRRTNHEENGYYQGDLQGVEHYTDEPTADIFTFGISALATYQGYRFLKSQDWAPDWIKNESVRLNFESHGRQSAMLKIEIDF